MTDSPVDLDAPALPAGGTRPGPSRRAFLGGVGVLGAAGVAGVLGATLGGGPAAGGATSCSTTPTVTEGPYWVDTQLLRSDIRANADGSGAQAGVPLTLTVTLFGNSACTVPLSGAHVDIWHANAAGHYSDFAAEGTAGQTWLRGYQVSDTDGRVTFTTIHPGWYDGRAIHIHVRVRTYSGSTKATDFTSQFFFDEAVNSAVIATSAYKHDASGRTLNARDGIYNQEVAGGGAVLVASGGDATTGYTGAVSMVLAAAATSPATSPATSASATSTGAAGGTPTGTVTVRPSSTTTTTASSPSSPSSPNVCRASLTHVDTKITKDRRTLRMTVKANEPVTLRAWMWNGHSWRRITTRAVPVGKRTITATIPDAIPHGRARVHVRLVDRQRAQKNTITKLRA